MIRPLILALLVAAPVAAGAAEPKPPPEVQAVIACTAIADGTQRLACLDKAAAALKAATGSGDLVVLARKDIEKQQRETFGLGRRPEVPGTPDLDQATFEVAAAAIGRDRHWLVVLKDGGTWRLVDTQDLGRDPKPGSKARIKKGGLGGFFIEIDGQPGMKAARLN